MSGMGFVHSFELDADHSLHIYRGSLAEVEADALVSSDDNYLTAGERDLPTRRSVARALAATAGSEVELERKKLVETARPKVGDVLRTSAGSLHCRFLYHAITIDFDTSSYLDEPALRRLMAELLEQAARDGVRSLGIPAIGTGAAFFDLKQAAEIIIDELLVRLIDSPVHRVVLALVGDAAEQLFYEHLVKARTDRLASLALRKRAIDANQPEDMPAEPPEPSSAEDALVGGTVEQFPSLVNETRLACTAPDRPKLVEGLADLVLKYAEPEEVEEELLSLAVCRGFRGTARQRLMEYLYLSEAHLRNALGPALFKNRELREIAKELGEDISLSRDQEQLITAILRALCFNTLEPPRGLVEYVTRVERLLIDLRTRHSDEPMLHTVAMEAGRILEQTFKDLMRIYGWVFWGPEFETEFVTRKIVPPPRRNGGAVATLTLGQARDAMEQLNALLRRDRELQGKWQLLGLQNCALRPQHIEAGEPREWLDSYTSLQAVIAMRNRAAHPGDHDPENCDEAARNLECLHAFLLACKTSGTYPDVLRYEGTFENRDGERFVYFLDERGSQRKIRTNEKIDARRHYYCFATNNPVHLHPTLVPKL